MSIPRIWSNLQGKANQPVCRHEEAALIKQGGIVPDLCLLSINTEIKDEAIDIFNFEAIESHPLTRESQIIIMENKKAEIASFIQAEGLTDISDSVFFICSMINQ